jgi:hypothetical protein
MTESSKFTRREVITGVTMALLPPVAGAAEVPFPGATLEWWARPPTMRSMV